MAELSGYELTAVRYGAPRKGTAAAIFVTEPFSETARVKADPGVHPPADEFPVMKLNLARDYPTGVYDYNEMLSAFIGLRPAGGRPEGTPAKISFSAQEWCGHIYTQLLPAGGAITVNSHSYFDGQADQIRNLTEVKDGLLEDAILLWARGMAAPFLEPGGRADVSMLASLFRARGAVDKLRWEQVSLRKGDKPETLRTPAGVFDVVRNEVSKSGRPAWTVFTEVAAPHRVVRWETAEGEAAVLTGSARLRYWELNAPGGERMLKQLGLKPRPARTM